MKFTKGYPSFKTQFYPDQQRLYATKNCTGFVFFGYFDYYF